MGCKQCVCMCQENERVSSEMCALLGDTSGTILNLSVVGSLCSSVEFFGLFFALVLSSIPIYFIHYSAHPLKFSYKRQQKEKRNGDPSILAFHGVWCTLPFKNFTRVKV